MLRNKEFRYLLIIQIIYSSLLLVFAVNGWLPTALIVVLLAVGVIGSSAWMTKKRYQEIRKLTSYLERLQNGERLMDIRDNSEGELSILKNEIYRLSIKLMSQNELLLKDKKYLSDSLSDISHQLKTPLTSMMVMTDLLEQNSLPEEKRKEFLKNITLGIERMQWLVQSLLKLSKLDADAVVMKQEDVEINRLIHKSTESFQIPMEIKGVELQIVEEPDQVHMIADFHWTSEAINNIVKNCMEHTKPGGRIQISYHQNSLYTKIVIEDTGVGIEKEDLPFIFERFYKGKNSSNDSVGIGLALSREIIIRQKGKIEVSSEVGKGTKFEIRFYR